eukprot:scaffold2487_cov75-Isochrysis_galbana.AAC.1
MSGGHGMPGPHPPTPTPFPPRAPAARGAAPDALTTETTVSAAAAYCELHHGRTRSARERGPPVPRATQAARNALCPDRAISQRALGERATSEGAGDTAPRTCPRGSDGFTPAECLERSHQTSHSGARTRAR